MKDKLVIFVSTRTPFQGVLFHLFAPYFILIIFECVFGSNLNSCTSWFNLVWTPDTDQLNQVRNYRKNIDLQLNCFEEIFGRYGLDYPLTDHEYTLYTKICDELKLGKTSQSNTFKLETYYAELLKSVEKNHFERWQEHSATLEMSGSSALSASMLKGFGFGGFSCSYTSLYEVFSNSRADVHSSRILVKDFKDSYIEMDILLQCSKEIVTRDYMVWENLTTQSRRITEIAESDLWWRKYLQYISTKQESVYSYPDILVHRTDLEQTIKRHMPNYKWTETDTIELFF